MDNKQQLTKEDLIQIAKVGFPDRVKEFIDFENCEMHRMGSVYRLYHKDEPFNFMLPSKYYLSVFIGEESFIQIGVTESRAFNDYAAIKYLEKIGIVQSVPTIQTPKPTHAEIVQVPDKIPSAFDHVKYNLPYLGEFTMDNVAKIA